MHRWPEFKGSISGRFLCLPAHLDPMSNDLKDLRAALEHQMALFGDLVVVPAGPDLLPSTTAAPSSLSPS